MGSGRRLDGFSGGIGGVNGVDGDCGIWGCILKEFCSFVYKISSDVYSGVIGGDEDYHFFQIIKDNFSFRLQYSWKGIVTP